MGQEDLQRRAARIGRVILHPGHGSHTSLDNYVRALLRYKYDEANRHTTGSWIRTAPSLSELNLPMGFIDIPVVQADSMIGNGPR